MKVDYKKHWNKETGTCYSQTITIDRDTMEKFNQYIMEEKIEVDKSFFKKHTYSDHDLKIKSIDYLDLGINYTNLIHLNLFISFYLNNIYISNDKNYERILDRNTIIKVVENYV